jgi:hypothetical protein
VAQEALGHAVVEERRQRAVVARDVEEPERLGVQAELRPREHLEELLERPDPAREHDERVGELGHERLALVHRADDAQVVEPRVADLEVEDLLGDDAGDLAARGAAASASAPIMPTAAP